MLELILASIAGISVGALSTYLFYFKNRIEEIANELADKKAILSAIYSHADELERENIKNNGTYNVKKEKPKKTVKEPTPQKRGRKSTKTK